MLSRIFYTIRQGWHYRRQLRAYCRDADLQATSIFAMQPQSLAAKGIETLVLDYDGVLAAHGDATPLLEAVTWLQEAGNKFHLDKIYILSNKPKAERQLYFKQNFPDIGFIIAPRKKPYPDGLQQILRESKCAPNQVLMVDDRLGTGILAAIIAGVPALFITQPYINQHGQTLKELGTMFLRWLEKLVYTA